MHNKTKGVCQARPRSGNSVLWEEQTPNAPPAGTGTESVSGVEQRPQKAHGRDGAAVSDPLANTSSAHGCSVCSLATPATQAQPYPPRRP